MDFHLIKRTKTSTQILGIDDISWPWNRLALSYDLLYFEHWKGALGFAVLQMELPFRMSSLFAFTWLIEDGFAFEIQALWFLQAEVRFTNPIWASFFKNRKKA